MKQHSAFKWIIGSLALLLVGVMLVAMSTGAVAISVIESINILLDGIGISQEVNTQQEMVLMSIRIPRVLLSVMVGAALGVSGAALQGLFRNPLVEPSLLGVSSGAALMAVTVIVFGAYFPYQWMETLQYYLLPIFAFIGSLVVVIITYSISQRQGRTDISLLLLAGIAMNALAVSLIGLIIYFADDQALRTFTFWSLGDLGGATWDKLGWTSLLVVLPSIGLLFYHRKLDAFALGEDEAYHLGISVEQVKYVVVILSTLAIGASVALIGTIGFVGLIVPHIIRTLVGPNHRLLLIASFIGGAILLTLADLIARTVVMPSELPIGIITALIGAPFFIGLLIQSKRKRLI
ncbi:MAG: FecCD family ABC transporter permease [Flammeovirgaceae bacterium]